MKSVMLPGGEPVPALGMGTWNVGDSARTRAEEIATLRLGLDLGLRLIDTAEMYGEGASESLVGEAIGGRRDDVFLVSKVYPHNAGLEGAVAACERSLRRLGTDRLDLYLLHWRGGVPFEETIEAFLRLQAAGKIRHFGVSNLDLADMEELWEVPGGNGIAVNQLLYNLSRRGIEYDLLPWLREHGVPVMAYSPIEQARLLRQPALRAFAERYGMTPAQAALGWLLQSDDIIAIPKTSHRDRLRENVRALEVAFTPQQLTELDRIFPPPRGPEPLAML
ncbi:aldo/keto reductase [Cupriavidus plantarum]|uniref:aldo/keto reductase n=1 Tax=Cupriavidus plantarum TaxID=942865 RepID=UPI000EB5238E|nr:aldo/keto reductase [Cupriavidus plantarum]NYH99008.1 diketogulonate reductase-like aldo/keto reductase [Cupriavidus plantarum]RLK44119.1 diketogulonate reductase-like aldo/keto reductase [Cupriavidus plantarum]